MFVLLIGAKRNYLMGLQLILVAHVRRAWAGGDIAHVISPPPQPQVVYAQTEDTFQQSCTILYIGPVQVHGLRCWYKKRG